MEESEPDELETLRAENRLLRAVFENFREALLVADPEGRFLLWNSKAEQYLGKPLRDLAPEDWSREYRLSLPDGSPFPSEQLPLVRALRGEEPAEFESVLVQSDSIPGGVWLSVSGFPLRSEGELLGGAVCYRPAAEPHDLLDRLTRQASLLSSWRDGVIGVNQQGQIFSWNAGAERTCGYSAEEVAGRPLASLSAPAARPDLGEALDEIRESGQAVGFETTLLDKSGQRVNVFLHFNPILDPASRVMGFSVLCHDLTALKVAESRWRSLLENIPGMVFNIDRKLRITFLNRAVPGLVPDEAVGRSALELVGPQYRQRAAEVCHQVFATGKRGRLEFEAQNVLTGEHHWYSSRIGPVVRHHQVESLIVITRDITRRKRAEEALTESERLLRSLSARLAQALEEERLRIARELHDELGQLLTALRLELALIESTMGEQHQGLFAPINDKLESTLTAVRRIATQLRPQLLDDLGVASAIDWLAQEICGRAELAYELKIDLGQSRLPQDQSLALFRITQEALTNVARHAQAHRVKICLQAGDGAVELLVEDDGRGITPDQATGEGSLGLLGISERAGMLGGTFEIGRAQTGGTRLRAHLPF
ncbi:MAG: PAS domain S-box protein [Candidatus Eremiobacteraeota bacterium]|nr:PAS domain S-box protein [Candidatus Eremiobacteraeota bacterium]